MPPIPGTIALNVDPGSQAKSALRNGSFAAANEFALGASGLGLFYRGKENQQPVPRASRVIHEKSSGMWEPKVVEYVPIRCDDIIVQL